MIFQIVSLAISIMEGQVKVHTQCIVGFAVSLSDQGPELSSSVRLVRRVSWLPSGPFDLSLRSSIDVIYTRRYLDPVL